MRKRILQYWLGFLVLGLMACTGKVLQYDKVEQLESNDEFEKQVKIVEVEPTPPLDLSIDLGSVPPGSVGHQPLSPVKNSKAPVKASKVSRKKKTQRKNSKSSKAQIKKESQAQNELAEGPPTEPQAPADSPIAKIDEPREPGLEDSVGFNGRRPIVDPFRVGEEVVHKVFYDSHLVNFSAGTLRLKVGPMVEVNGRKAYQLITSVKSSPWFSSYYSVDDEAVTLLDYELLIPRVFTLHIKESSQLREVKSFFDFDNLKASYWEKKVTKKSGVEEKKLQWDILEYSQNVYSCMFYLRTFQWEAGKEYSFRVSDDGENLVFKAKALLRETLQTDIGPRPAIKIKPEFTVQGAFKPVGDIYIWIADDDRRMILKIESKIKIGTLVSEITSLTP